MTEKFLHDTAGERPNQLLITCDKKGNITGTASRESCHKGKGLIHLAFMSFLLDKKGKVILTKRSPTKSLWGNFWDASIVSHVLPGESVEEAAKRRGKEELGVDIEYRDIGAFYYSEKYQDDAENEYCHILLGMSYRKPDINPVEIEEMKLITFKNLKKEIEKKPKIFTPWLRISIKNKQLNEYFT